MLFDANNVKSYEWAGAELNRRHTDFQSVALPAELPARTMSGKTGKLANSRWVCKKKSPQKSIKGRPPVAFIRNPILKIQIFSYQLTCQRAQFKNLGF
jgi:hypothetical protein